MSGGWIAFLILLAFVAGFATAIRWGQWYVNQKKEKKS
ncbi:hypothetical protein ES705_25383 [subsurface metagenome]